MTQVFFSHGRGKSFRELGNRLCTTSDVPTLGRFRERLWGFPTQRADDQPGGRHVSEENVCRRSCLSVD